MFEWRAKVKESKFEKVVEKLKGTNECCETVRIGRKLS